MYTFTILSLDTVDEKLQQLAAGFKAYKDAKEKFIAARKLLVSLGIELDNEENAPKHSPKARATITPASHPEEPLNWDMRKMEVKRWFRENRNANPQLYKQAKNRLMAAGKAPAWLINDLDPPMPGRRAAKA